jgi:hypothetical protein
MLCKFCCFHGGDYEECRLLECHTMCFMWEPTFRRNIFPSSGWEESANQEQR